VDSAGNLYIGDSGNNRIRKVSNGVIATVAETGRFGFSGDNGPATSAQLANPYGVAIDSAGNLYIGDSGNSRIRVSAPLPIIRSVVKRSQLRHRAGLSRRDGLPSLARPSDRPPRHPPPWTRPPVNWQPTSAACKCYSMAPRLP